MKHPQPTLAAVVTAVAPLPAVVLAVVIVAVAAVVNAVLKAVTAVAEIKGQTMIVAVAALVTAVAEHCELIKGNTTCMIGWTGILFHAHPQIKLKRGRKDARHLLQPPQIFRSQKTLAKGIS